MPPKIIVSVGKVHLYKMKNRKYNKSNGRYNVEGKPYFGIFGGVGIFP
jgi:hypothetical protein